MINKETVSEKDLKKQTALKRVQKRLQAIEDNYGDTAKGWANAYHYLEVNGIDTYFMTAIGIGFGHDVRQWMYDYYVSDENEGAQTAHRIAEELESIDDNGVYLNNQGLDAYNHGTFMPSDVTPVDSDTIQEAFHQMIQSLKDFPERY